MNCLSGASHLYRVEEENWNITSCLMGIACVRVHRADSVRFGLGLNSHIRLSPVPSWQDDNSELGGVESEEAPPGGAARHHKEAGDPGEVESARLRNGTSPL